MSNIISFYRKGDGFSTSKETRDVIKKSLEKKKEVYYQAVSEKKARSNSQNSFYWSVALRLMSTYCDSLTGFVELDINGNKNYSALHRYLTLYFCLENNRCDLITTLKTYSGGQWIDVPMCSFSFDKMKAKDATAYIEWLENKFKLSTGGAGFNTMLEHEQNEVQS